MNDAMITHDERRMHLPELSDQCWRCLRTENEKLRQLLREWAGPVREQKPDLIHRTEQVIQPDERPTP